MQIFPTQIWTILHLKNYLKENHWSDWSRIFCAWSLHPFVSIHKFSCSYHISFIQKQLRTTNLFFGTLFWILSYITILVISTHACFECEPPLYQIFDHIDHKKSPFKVNYDMFQIKFCFFRNFAANRRSQNRVDVPTMGQYQFWDTVICSLLKHMREKVAHVMAVCQILTWKITFGSTSR